MASPRNPIFIIGSPRTGSSVLHWSLCQSPTLWGSSESDFLHELAPAVANAWRRGCEKGEYSWLVKQSVTEEEFFTRIGRAVDDLYRSRSGGLRWIDQTPYYVHVAEDILRLLPESRFLVLFRDGRQATPSIETLLGYEFPDAAREWTETTEKGLAFMERHPDRCHPVCYEDLILNTPECLERVYAFLEEPFREPSVSFIRERAPINSSFEQESSLDKLQPRWLDWSWFKRRAFQQLSNGLLETLGYESDREWLGFATPAPPDERTLRERVANVVRTLESLAAAPVGAD